jgi:hypothetical protein
MGSVDEVDPVPGAPSDNTTLVELIDDLQALGFDHDMQVTDIGMLCCRECGHCVAAQDMELLELRRLEGASDVSDMAAVLGLRCGGCGARGIAIVRYGPEAGPGDEIVLRHLPDHR